MLNNYRTHYDDQKHFYEEELDMEDKSEDPNKNLRNVSQIMRVILSDRDCKHLLFFIILFAFGTLLQIIFGSLARSLGLISAAFHSTFDCISLIISLAAMILAKHKPTRRFSYGYDRFEVLSSFSNGIFLLFVSLFLIFGSIERLVEPIEIQSQHADLVIGVAILGFLVNMVGVLFFGPHGKLGNRAEIKQAREENVYSIFVHVLVDAIGSLGVVLSSWITSRGWLLADPLVAILIAFLIIYNAIPICNRTGKVLLQTTPILIKDQLERALRECSTLEGVIECKNEHFWTQSPGIFVGSICVRVRSDADLQMILQRIHTIFGSLVTHFTAQIEKEDWNINEAQLF